MKNKPTLLLIDDNKRLTVILSDFLEYEGFHVVVANNGEEALLKLEKITPDIIILDINMPGIGGIGFLSYLKSNNLHPDCPVLVFTARSTMEEFFSTLDVAGFISKPCSQTELLDKIKQIIEAKSDKKGKHVEESQSLKVLLGEDDNDIITQLAVKLRHDGLDYHVVKSGGEIVESAAVLKPDIIVMKDILPGMNGRVIVPLLRTMPSTKNIPIILYDDTRSTEDENRYGRRIPEGVTKYLNTSEATSLLAAIKKHVKKL